MPNRKMVLTFGNMNVEGKKMKFEEAIKAAAEVSRKYGKSCELIFDGCETNLMVSAYQGYEDVYVCLRGEEQSENP